MATMILTSEGNPIFASRNWINRDSLDYGTFTADEMSSILPRIIDGDRFSYWSGSSTSDLTTVSLVFSFQKRGTTFPRTFDLVILQNINWKNFYAEYRNATTGAWVSISQLDYSVSNNAEDDLIVNIPAGVTADGIRFYVSTTITANEAKKCGGIIVCQSVLQLSMGFLDYQVKHKESLREMELGDKTPSREYVRWSAASYELWGASFDCPFATRAELALLRTVKREGYPFVFIPEPGLAPEDTYQVEFAGPWGHKYENPVRSLGFAIPMKVLQVGEHS